MTIEDIKPCPFCGGFAELMEFDGLESYDVVCNDCGAGITSFDVGEEAIYAWNRREYMKWTTDKPTKPGRYLICDDRDDKPEIVDVELLCDELWYSYHDSPCHDMVCNSMAHWSSEPIPMPEGS
jgi:Lar family restriction alleviation protein